MNSNAHGALTGTQIEEADLHDWRLVLGRLVARFETGSFQAGCDLIVRITEAAEAANHHPDIDLRYPHVTIGLKSHDVDAVTARDVELARQISGIARESSISAGQAPDVLELALDTSDREHLTPFYSALFGFEVGQPDEVSDPSGRHPSVWFQASDSSAADRQRWHIDVSVPHDAAEARLQAVINAGGTLIDDSEAPAFWVVADPDGNRSCICTWQGR